MTTDNILIESTLKLLQINTINDWTNELLAKAPPVLWFGNSKSEKPKILTIGANPSRWEFLDRSDKKSWPLPLIKSFYETKYLKPYDRRFLHIQQDQSLNEILTCQKLRNEIIRSYDNYFFNNPYHWFGSNKDSPYNAEGILRGLDASYFDIDTKYRACHIDLFPFSTISDFNKIQKIIERDILVNSWAKIIVDELFLFLNPELIIVFGKSNFKYFCRYFKIDNTNNSCWKTQDNKGNCKYWLTQYNSFKIIGLSVNLGNPKGFNSKGLKELGTYLKNITYP